MPIIATAGHVDHGKSTLIEALTGRDPDRWAEEKERGLTIDLGFAWTNLGGIDVGFVDVPGHERFIKNMLAGVGAIDVALFVVAADEGWMPQSEEHLAILDVLGTQRGVIALTRTDLADDDTIDLAELGVLETVDGTSLEGWPIIRVSPVTGQGMDQLRVALQHELHRAGEPQDSNRPRLWIDRSFRVPGTGLVVTGTLVGGHLEVGEELMLWPTETRIRIRGLQQHDTETRRLAPGSRAALNIAGVDRADRGNMLGRPNDYATTRSLLALISVVRSFPDELSGRGAFHLHAGSGSWPVKLRMIPDQELIAVASSEKPLPLHTGDRFVLRETGRRAVVAGGVVLDPHPPVRRDGLLAAVPLLRDALGKNPDAIADALLEVRGSATDIQLSQDSGGGIATSPHRVAEMLFSPQRVLQLAGEIRGHTAVFHAEHPLRPWDFESRTRFRPWDQSRHHQRCCRR